MATDGWTVHNQQGSLIIQANTRTHRLVADFDQTYLDLLPELEAGTLMFVEGSNPPRMPNCWRTLSKGCRVVSLPLMVWADNVSGNLLKKFNKHHIIMEMIK
ncbi:hypothetical protein DACRYDRAFT_103750 [Dacryopinax primogenitus]|uniref:Uncharacterized protein n=1 Tax=Dacryopinax primogenitus (strain DJM 731) TaxID=1858805 RepID=M5GEB5_DACPD|nr:uncharacterized protein DACRYDRAFT_103750 [Dacryopinax primogenitus]EJU05257.1 hypothetical protein DACRYDRAFT_103750 [Dacryopinax primogenitus]